MLNIESCIKFLYQELLTAFYVKIKQVNEEIILLTLQGFQNLLAPRMSPVWDIVVGIFAPKTMPKMG